MSGLARVVLIGGGEHARVVAEAIRHATVAFELLGFVDPAPCEETIRRLNLPRLGDDSAIPAGTLGVLGVGVLGGASSARAAIAARLNSRLAGWAAVVHRSAWVSPTAVVEPGAVVMARAAVNTGARIGTHAIVNTSAVVEHDVVVGAHAQIGPGAALGGGAAVGTATIVGLGARVRDHVTVGAGALVAMGAVVVANVPDGVRVAGVPARVMP